MDYSNKKKNALQSVIGKIAMVDAGRKISPHPVDIKSIGREVIYPHLSLSGKEAPMLKGVKIGENVRLVIDAIVKECNSRSGISGEEHHSYDLEIRKIGKDG